MMNNRPPPARVPVCDPNTGIMTREWYLFFQALTIADQDAAQEPIAGGGFDLTASLLASFDDLRKGPVVL